MFVRDRLRGKTVRVSVDSRGREAKVGTVNVPMISASGRYVGFFSRASDLVRGDRNDRFDLFVHDRETGETTRANVSSSSSNLVPGDTNRATDVFAHDPVTHRTTRLSVDSSGAQAFGSHPAEAGYAHSEGPFVSADGRWATFTDPLASDRSLLLRGPLF